MYKKVVKPYVCYCCATVGCVHDLYDDATRVITTVFIAAMLAWLG